jgi:hypothetical protein
VSGEEPVGTITPAEGPGVTGLPSPPLPPGPPILLPPPPPTRLAPRGIAVVLVILLAAGSVAVLTSTTAQRRGDFTFLNTAIDGSPDRWNPCEPIHYRVNLADAPPQAMDDLREAMERVTDATGIGFVDDGRTDEDVLDMQGHVFQAGLPGQRWLPVLVTWLPQDDFQQLAQRPGALAFAYPQTGDGTLADQYVSGFVVVDAGAGLQPGFDARYAEGLVLMHELGHLVGLGHVGDPNEVMFQARDVAPSPIHDWGPGDLAGLERLGRDAGCLTDIRDDG